MTVTIFDDVDYPSAGCMASTRGVSFVEHEHMALAMLDIDFGDVADMEEAIRRIITSAPEGTDVALTLLLATAHARDRVVSGDDDSYTSLTALNPFCT